MSSASLSTWASIGLSLALTLSGCKSNSGGGDSTASDRAEVVFPQTTETMVTDPANPPKPGAAVKTVYTDMAYGKTEVREDEYVRHADPASPTHWTPWHYRSAPHTWGPMTYESTVSGTWTARVQSIDLAQHRITLQGPSGKSETFQVKPQDPRLNGVNVGDNLMLAWRAKLFGELRPPTAEESATPIKVYTAVDPASSDAAPTTNPSMATTKPTAMRVVTTIESMDLSGMLVTLKGPLGNRIEIRAKNAENIRKLHVGDSVVVIYSEGEVVSVSKVP